MLMLELILTKPPDEWTDEDWAHVRRVVQGAEINPIASMIQLPVQQLKTYDFHPVCFDRPCQVVEFFKSHPECKVASISCSCPNCTIQYATG